MNIFRNFKKGTVLLKEGDVIKSGHFVIKGCSHSYFIIDSEEKTTAFYTENEVLTPLAGADKSRAAHFVSCVEDSIVTVENPEMGKDLVENFPRFEKLCLIISEQLLEKNLASFAEFKKFYS